MRGLGILALCLSMALAAGCGGGGGSASSQSSTPPPASSGQNVQPITVNGGPVGGYPDGVFTSVTVCTPGSSSCNTISGVLVDTGSVGLRLLSSTVTLSLPPETSGGNPLSNCVQFVDGSYLWGSVATAEVKLSGETAASVPIQLISDATTGIPAACSNGGMNEGTVQTLGANGILGVGPYLQDCGGACAVNASIGLYYSCPASGCVETTVPVGQQVQNPVSLFASDNNGVVLELPSVPTEEATANGSLVFGIGTQSNNGLGSAKVYTFNAQGYFSTSFNSQSFPQSFIDSGSNGYFFADNSITQCSDNGFYCPATPLSLSATNQGANGTNATVTFGVGNADLLFSNISDNAMSTLAGPNTSGSFDWGLPFFFGRNVFTAIETKSTPGGAGPYWAY
jgi:Protein of unknown function (DUF3443)